MNLLDQMERDENERLHAAGAVQSESPFSRVELWLLPGRTAGHVSRSEALAWLRRQEEGEQP